MPKHSKDVAKLKKAGEEVMANIVSANFPEIVKAQVDLAKGIYAEKLVPEYDANGQKTGMKKVIVYKEPPDGSIGQFLINQLAGKPKETVEHKGAVTLIIDE